MSSRQLQQALAVMLLFVVWTAVVRIGVSQGSRRSAWSPHSFDDWPATFGAVAGSGNYEFSLFASYEVEAATAQIPPLAGAIGHPTIGSDRDSNDSGTMNGSRFVTGVMAGTVSSLSVYVAGRVDAAPHDQFQVAIYTDAGGAPGALVAKSASGVLTPNAWSTAAVRAVLAPKTPYWIMYNTNGSNGAVNNLTYTPLVANPLDSVVRAFQPTWLDRVARMLSYLGDAPSTVVMALCLSIWAGSKRLPLGVVLLAGFTLGLLLEIVLKQSLFYPYQQYPSGHALRAVFLATALASITCNRAARAGAALLALLVSLSVVYTGGHYAEEAIGGALAGWALATAAAAIAAEPSRHSARSHNTL